MDNKRAKAQRNAKGLLIVQLIVQKRSKPAKGRPINKQKRGETLNEGLLRNQMRKKIDN